VGVAGAAGREDGEGGACRRQFLQNARTLFSELPGPGRIAGHQAAEQTGRIQQSAPVGGGQWRPAAVEWSKRRLPGGGFGIAPGAPVLDRSGQRDDGCRQAVRGCFGLAQYAVEPGKRDRQRLPVPSSGSSAEQPLNRLALLGGGVGEDDRGVQRLAVRDPLAYPVEQPGCVGAAEHPPQPGQVHSAPPGNAGTQRPVDQGITGARGASR
jgi:hypothetical protein